MSFDGDYYDFTGDEFFLQIMEFKYTSMMALDIKTTHLKDSPQCSKSQAQIQAVKCQAQPLVSFLHFVREIFQVWVWL